MAIKRKKWKPKMTMQEMGRYSILVLVIFSLVIMTMLGYSLIGMRRASIESTTRYVQNLTKQLTSMIDLEIDRGRQQLLSVGDSYEQVVEKKDNAAAQEFMTRKQLLCGFDFIALEDTKNNRTVMAGTFPSDYSDGTQTLYELPTSRRALKKEACEVGIEDENVIYALPLYDGEEQMGFLWAGTRAESMREIISSRSSQERSYSCIISKSGDLILSADKQKEFKNLQSIFISGNDSALQKNLQVMQKNIEADQSGIFRFVTEGGNHVYLAYTPMAGDRRVMLTIVPTDFMSTDYDSYVYMATLAVVGTLLVFMGFLILLIRVHRSNRKKLEQLAFVDEVTGGKNNQAFWMNCRELCRKTDVREYVIVLVDIVNFKEINKKFGAKQGDDMLHYLYMVFDSCLNENALEFVARSEMDHFFLCLKEQEQEGVQKRLDMMMEKINSFEDTQLPKYHLFFRMAASFAEERNITPIVLQDRCRSVLKMTDTLLGKCVFYSKDFEARIHREQELDAAFEAALAAEEFQVYFQPKVSLENGRVEGAEALVRWHHPKLGLVSPAEFIPLLERNSKILLLDKYMFEKVCIWLRKRQDGEEPMFPVSINLSRSNLQNEDFFAWFVDTADRHGVCHQYIEFELTESTFMVSDQVNQMRVYITQMHEMGFAVSIDDFGTGYSSISLLREFDVDVLKLDRTFFLDLDDPKARDVICCLLELAKKLNIRIVVEGIETEKQIEYLKELSCDVIQGYFFSKPLPEEQFNHWYRSFDFKKYGI